MLGVQRVHFVLLCLLMIFTNFTQTRVNEVDDASRILSRRKRYLIFPEGSNMQLVFCLTIGTYARENNVVMGMTAALAWELPSKVDSKISELLHRRSRSVVFPKIEALLQSTGLDGKACVMRALCEAAQRDPSQIGKGTLVQELLHAIFTLPRDGGRFERSGDQAYDHAYQATENCEQLYPSCRHSIYELSLAKSANKTIDRSKRDFDAKYLVFPQGSNVQLVFCLTVPTYAKPSGFSTIGVTAGQAWELPYESMLSSKYLADAYHRRSRRELYRKLGLLLEIQGKGGGDCVLKAICKASKRNLTDVGKGDFLDEILHSVFSLPESLDDTDLLTEHEKASLREENCEKLEDRCPDVF